LKTQHVLLPNIFIAALAVVALLHAVGQPLPSFVHNYLFAINVFSFLVFGLDKLKAMRGEWRVPEKVLHILTLTGGVAGASIGRLTFHHKTKKPGFALVAVAGTICLFCFVSMSKPYF